MTYQDLDMPTKIIKENAITFHLDFFYLPFNDLFLFSENILLEKLIAEQIAISMGTFPKYFNVTLGRPVAHSFDYCFNKKMDIDFCERQSTWLMTDLFVKISCVLKFYYV